jgi:hypothetical protein
MSRCILLPYSLLLVLIQLVCESMRGMMCIRWSNLVVVVNCDNNFMTCYGVCQSVVTSLGIKRMHVLYFLVSAKNPKLTLIDHDLF